MVAPHKLASWQADKAKGEEIEKIYTYPNPYIGAKTQDDKKANLNNIQIQSNRRYQESSN
jgi:hypothetical protein